MLLTVEYVYDRVRGKRVARRARVVAGMCAGCPFDVQVAVLVGQVGRHVHSPVDVVVDHPAVVVPEYEHRVHGALPDHALQVQRAVEHQILFGSACNLGLGFCKTKQNPRETLLPNWSQSAAVQSGPAHWTIARRTRGSITRNDRVEMDSDYRVDKATRDRGRCFADV